MKRGDRCLLPARVLFLCLVVLILFGNIDAQKKRPVQPRTKQTKPVSELKKLRKDYIELTRQYKASLEKLLPLYQSSQRKAEDRFAKSKELFQQGLISKSELDDSEQAVTIAKAKVA